MKPRAARASRSVRCLAPGKVNLGLRVVGRRADGYHELSSLFAPLDFGDDVEVAVCDSGELEVALELAGACEAVPADASNLAFRAACAFARAAGLECRIELRIEKRVPVGAGLGGGSSDAGAVLRALDELFPGALASAQLEKIALELGADVPFFLDPRPARVTGIGERREPVRGLRALALLLANPGVALATADVFRAYASIRPALGARSAAPQSAPPRSAAEPLTSAAGDPGPVSAETPVEPTAPAESPGPAARPALSELAGLHALSLENDLEPIAVRLCPPIARLQRQLLALDARAVGMSGSGATVFGVFESTGAAQRALEKAAFEPPVWARVASTRESR